MFNSFIKRKCRKRFGRNVHYTSSFYTIWVRVRKFMGILLCHFKVYRIFDWCFFSVLSVGELQILLFRLALTVEWWTIISKKPFVFFSILLIISLFSSMISKLRYYTVTLALAENAFGNYNVKLIPSETELGNFTDRCGMELWEICIRKDLRRNMWNGTGIRNTAAGQDLEVNWVVS